jgi:hypothetical protein
MGAHVFVAGCGDDAACVTPTTWCSEGAVMRCTNGAPVMELDCLALSEELGIEKQCGATKNSEDRTCVDLRQMSCPTVGASECTQNRKAVRTCTGTDFGMVWNAGSLSPTCTAGQLCQPTNAGEFVCVTPPTTACAGKAQCEGTTLQMCAGNATDGYVLVSSMNCPAQCEVRIDGTTVCN